MSVNEQQLREVLMEFFVDSDRHVEHHAWIEARIEAERAKRDFYRSVAKTVVSWSLPVILAAVWGWFSNIWGR